jgi:hypothetical protein
MLNIMSRNSQKKFYVWHIADERAPFPVSTERLSNYKAINIKVPATAMWKIHSI